MQRKKDIRFIMKQAYANMGIDYICKTEITELFPGEHNVGVYYQKLLSTYFYYLGTKLVEGETFYYETTQAIKDLNLSEKQITACRKKLVEDEWISIKRKSVGKKIRNLIYINLDKLQRELSNKGLLIELLVE